MPSLKPSIECQLARRDSSGFGEVEDCLVAGGVPAALVAALLREYEETKRRSFLGDHGPGAVNGGRFCEAAVRIVQSLGKGSYVPLGSDLSVEKALVGIENDTTLDEGLRLHVPRAIRLIYGIRNKRNAGHLKGGIDPSRQDATLIVGALDWVLAELIRVVHGLSAEQAQGLVNSIVSKDLPLVAEYDGRPVVLRDMKQLDHLLVVLYWAKHDSVSQKDLRSWLPAKVVTNLKRLLDSGSRRHLIYVDGERVYLTPVGIRYIEGSGLLSPT